MCAFTEPNSDLYRSTVRSVERSLGRAQSSYEVFSEGHAPTERQIRVVLTALDVARTVLRALESTPPPEAEDLERLAGKTQRAIARASGSVTAP